ncbi:phage tail protein, partial [Pantoea endophytica]
LSAGFCTIYGMLVIERVTQTTPEFFSKCVGRRIEFTLTLKRTDESLGEMFGSLSDQLSAMQGAATDAAGKVGAAVGGLFS